MLNIRFLSRIWAVTVADAGQDGKVVLSAFNNRFGVGVTEDVSPEVWADTSQEHREELMRSLASIALIHHADNLRRLVEAPERSTEQVKAKQAA